MTKKNKVYGLSGQLTSAILSLLFLFAACNFGSKGGTAMSPASGVVEKISPRETQGLLINGFATLVDVREDDEIKDGMAVGAQWMPMSKIEANSPEWVEFQKKLPKDKKVVVYCAAGGRAGKVAKLLSEQGFKAANMGGFKDWAAEGLQTKKP